VLRGATCKGTDLGFESGVFLCEKKSRDLCGDFLGLKNCFFGPIVGLLEIPLTTGS
jgi:hypothetical protein